MTAVPKCEGLTTTYRRDDAREQQIPAIPREGVRIEIKPHNSDGIRDGVRQLVDNRRKEKGMPLLLTYRTEDASDPSKYEVLMASPRELADVIRTPDLRGSKGQRVLLPQRLTTWYKIGRFDERCALWPIPFHTCPALLGNKVEGKVVTAYETFMQRSHPGFSVARKHPSTPGHDILHEELADFLAELAVQLQAA